MLSLEAAATMAREMGRLVERLAIRGWTLKSTRRVATSVGECATEKDGEGGKEGRERVRKRKRENTGEFTSPGEFLQDLISRVHVHAHVRECARSPHMHGGPHARRMVYSFGKFSHAVDGYS